MPLRQLPRNGTDRTRTLVSIDGEIQNMPVDRTLAETSVEHAEPIREFFAWSHKRNYEGHWFSTTTGTHIRFESLLERQFLLTADHDPEVTAISAQPLAFLWPAKSRSPKGKELRTHVPDFFCRYANGDGGLVDVRRPDKADDPHFELTQRLCDELGWRYTVFTGVDSPTTEALDWLAGYRMDRYAPAPDARAALLIAFSPETSLRTGVHGTSRRTGISRDIILGNTLYLLFHCELHFDHARPLTMESTIRPHREMSS